MAVKIDKSKCTGCRICVQICPVEAITVVRVAIISAEKCINCESCVAQCPNKALSMDWERIASSPGGSVPSPQLATFASGQQNNLYASSRSAVERPTFRRVDNGGFLKQIVEFFGRKIGTSGGQGRGRGGGGGGCGGGGRGKGHRGW